MADDVAYIAEQIKEAEQPSKEELGFLNNLKVCLRHTVPPQHEVEKRAGSRPLTQEELDEFMKYVLIKRGTYSPEEDEIIVHNWKAFCKIHKWNVTNVKPFLILRLSTTTSYIRSKQQRRRFVQFLADGLPNRTLFSVYQRFRLLYFKHSHGRYDAHEDKMILDHIEDNPNLDVKRKFADLAMVLKRSRTSIWKRYRLLVSKRRIKEENE